MDIRERIAENDPEALFADGFDDCIIGWSDSWSGGARPVRVVYSADKVIQKLIIEGASYEEAQEHFDFNIIGAYVGLNTPIFVWETPPS